MRKEFFFYKGLCVIESRALSTGGYCLEMATEDLAQKACYLNGIFFEGHSLRIHRDKNCVSTPRFSSWNEYYFHTHEKNSSDTHKWIHVTRGSDQKCDTGVGEKIAKFMNRTIKAHQLCHIDAIKAVTLIPTKQQNSFFFETQSLVLTGLLCYFDGIIFEGSPLMIRRLDGWKGPKPKYRNYNDFKKKGDNFNIFFLRQYPADWRLEEIKSFLNGKMSELKGFKQLNGKIGYIVDVSPFDERECLALLAVGEEVKQYIRCLNEQTLSGFGVILSSSEHTEATSRRSFSEATANAIAKAKQSASPVSLQDRAAPTSNNDKTVYVYDLPSGMNVTQFCDIFSDTVRKKGLLDDGVEKPIVQFSVCDATNNIALTMATEELVDIILFFNNVQFPGFGTLQIGRDPLGGEFSSRVVNIVLPKEWENKTSKQIRSIITRNMRLNGILTGDTAVVSCLSTTGAGTSQARRHLKMLNSDLAEKLMYLNGMPLGNESEGELCLSRHEDYEGPAPKFSSYAAFMKSRETNSSKPASEPAASELSEGVAHIVEKEHGKSNKTASGSTGDPEISASSRDAPAKSASAAHDCASGAIRAGRSETGTISNPDGSEANTEETRRLENRIALENENKRLKLEVDALSKSNLQKVEIKSKVKNRLSSLRDQLAARQQQVAAVRKNNSDAASELTEAQQRLDAVHKSWQEQVAELSSKQIEIDDLSKQVQELQRQAQNVTDSLLEERRAKKLVTDKVHKLQAEYRELKSGNSRPSDGDRSTATQALIKEGG